MCVKRVNLKTVQSKESVTLAGYKPVTVAHFLKITSFFVIIFTFQTNVCVKLKQFIKRRFIVINLNFLKIGFSPIH